MGDLREEGAPEAPLAITPSGRVIRAGDSVAVSPLYDAQREGARVIEEARREARRLLEEAEEEARRLAAAAQAEGRERGLAAVTELLVAARAALEQARQISEGELRSLAVRIAEKLLGRELQLSPSAVVDVARTALRHAGQARALTLRVHPEDLARLESGRPRLLERCRTDALLTVRSDSDLQPGGCIIESELGIVDARLSTQLEAIERALRGAPTSGAGR
jgi:type III secretion protein L